MKKLLETLYITTPESYLFERNGNICISIGGAEKAAVPITQVNSIVLFGKNTLSTALLSFCSQKRRDDYISQRERLFSGTAMRPGQRKCAVKKAPV